MNGKAVSSEDMVLAVVPPKKDFWDHNDGSFQRKSIPGIMVWRSDSGEITLKCHLNAEIGDEKYCSITAILVPKNANPIVIPQTPHKITLESQISYTLILFYVSTTGKRITMGNLLVEFYPEE
ncbi:MAG TPA: hypothetical protein PLI45_05070 [Candidatus Woesebacteria bacterium]|nr:hypothetical protein [Candidatus Woesebacteria bacterium]